LLAKLFARPANVIVLDEPTNDLDSETLELLEEKLMEFKGTILMVSHDREFLNNVVTSTIVFESEGINEYVGGYDDWVRQTGGALVAKAEIKPPKTESKPETASNKDSDQPRKLKYKERLELEKLPTQIEELEQKIAAIHQAMADPAYFKESSEKISQAQKQLADHEAKLTQAMLRWEELESLA
jgi:ATP-binding cassette subfamily F protein uup